LLGALPSISSNNRRDALFLLTVACDAEATGAFTIVDRSTSAAQDSLGPLFELMGWRL
jgi:hypothetical protein